MARERERDGNSENHKEIDGHSETPIGAVRIWRPSDAKPL